MANFKYTTSDLIEKFRAVHGDKYDYSEYVYNGMWAKSVFICPEHGRFEQTSLMHLKTCGCKKCTFERKRRARAKHFSSFVAKARALHGDKYSYLNFIYLGSMVEGEITCPEHGSFLMTPRKHLRKSGTSGCPKCLAKPVHSTKALTIDQFTERANAIHNYRYDYSKFKYVNMHTAGTVICGDHGEFSVNPMSHLSFKTGCPACAKRRSSYIPQLITWLNEEQHIKAVQSPHCDILLPERAIGIFVNNPRYHTCDTSLKFYRDKRYHEYKSDVLKEQYSCSAYHFWAHRGRYTPLRLIQDWILSRLTIFPNGEISSGECHFRDVAYPEARSFFYSNDIHGSFCSHSPDQKYYGAYSRRDGELVLCIAYMLTDTGDVHIVQYAGRSGVKLLDVWPLFLYHWQEAMAAHYPGYHFDGHALFVKEDRDLIFDASASVWVKFGFRVRKDLGPQIYWHTSRPVIHEGKRILPSNRMLASLWFKRVFSDITSFEIGSSDYIQFVAKYGIHPVYNSGAYLFHRPM